MENKKNNIEKALSLLVNSNKSGYQIGKDTGITEATIGNYKNGKTKPTVANANILIRYFENNGGSMLNNSDSVLLSELVGKGLPLIPFEFIAGYGEDNSGIKLNECERYIIPEFENIGAEFLVRVGGSSMYPKYSSGDILACRKIYEILFFQWGKVYVIDSSQGQLIKRICRHENEDMVWLVSDNKEKYEPFAIPKSDIRSLSIVVGVVRME